MKPTWWGRAALVGAVVVPFAAAAALVPFRDRLGNTNIALILVTSVVAVAAWGGRTAGAVAAVSAALSFDFFHTRPYYSLTITRHADVETAVLLLAVGLIVGELSSRSTRHRLNAHESSADIARIHSVVELVAGGATADEVIVAVRNEIRDLLYLQDCTFTREFATRPRPRLERDGEVMMAGLRWGVSRMGIPGKEVDLIVIGRGHPVGRFVLMPTPGVPVSWDRRLVAVALADQVGAALSSAGSSLHIS
jgi:K+-sensing histidine kinase KdpD